MRKVARRLLKTGAKTLGVPMIDLSATLAGDAKWHQNFIIHLASVTKPAVYVELGIFHCGLFNQILPYVGEAIGVDINPDAGKFMAKNFKGRFIAATSDQLAAQFQANPISIDFLFIDADHSKEAVAADFCNLFPFVRPHGLIVLHDTHPIDDAATAPERCGDGYLEIERLSRETEAFELMTIPVHPGLSLCRKRTRQLSWMEPAADETSLGASVSRKHGAKP